MVNFSCIKRAGFSVIVIEAELFQFQAILTLKLVLGVGLITVGGCGGKGTVVPGVSLDSIFVPDSSSLTQK